MSVIYIFQQAVQEAKPHGPMKLLKSCGKWTSVWLGLKVVFLIKRLYLEAFWGIFELFVNDFAW